MPIPDGPAKAQAAGLLILRMKQVRCVMVHLMWGVHGFLQDTSETAHHTHLPLDAQPLSRGLPMWNEDEEERKAMLRWRIMRVFLTFFFLMPIILVTLWSPLPLAWYVDGGNAGITTEPEGPQSTGKVASIVYTVGLPETCGRSIPGPIILFIGPSERNSDRTVALGLAPTLGGLGVRAMELPEGLADWTDPNSGEGVVLLARDPTRAVLPDPFREGSYWRVQGTVDFEGALYTGRSVAPIGIATQSAGILTATMEPGNPQVATSVSVDIRWLAARRGPLGLPLYCW
jgi:hypothetical protein